MLGFRNKTNPKRNDLLYQQAEEGKFINVEEKKPSSKREIFTKLFT
jgi:hypothetical protein